ncbi:probable carbohydrate esterase At4g34215 [Impatiens glandulifera]|uniref:probable carbohydrate esterase At4g34215 n=1 Tax=Impatiens glandulifera TaxID=253017 RepID=UPI001FB113F3|nr:probable carbohydrate esterase At4g34215 [Impatiens glandulifera]
MKKKKMVKNVFFFIILFNLYTNLIAISNSPINIFILAGQSNMAGRGGVIANIWDGIIPIESSPNPSIYRFNAGLEWEQANEPLHWDIDIRNNKTCGIGPGLAFANSILSRNPNLETVGLVPCAVGGTNISQWEKGSFLYNQMIRRTLAAAAAAGGGAIRGVLWYQGESDTKEKKDSELYKGKLKMFFINLRSDLQNPFLPIIQVALASGEGHYVKEIREAQFSVGSELANIRIVDAKGLPLNPDGLHLSTQAQVRLGEMLAQSFLNDLPLASPILISSALTKSIDFFLLSISLCILEPSYFQCARFWA